MKQSEIYALWWASESAEERKPWHSLQLAMPRLCSITFGYSRTHAQPNSLTTQQYRFLMFTNILKALGSDSYRHCFILTLSPPSDLVLPYVTTGPNGQPTGVWEAGHVLFYIETYQVVSFFGNLYLPFWIWVKWWVYIVQRGGEILVLSTPTMYCRVCQTRRSIQYI
jgi:hypothetical protein